MQSQTNTMQSQHGHCLFQHQQHSQYPTVTPTGWHSSALMGRQRWLWINTELYHFMWDCYSVHMLKEERLWHELWAPGGSLSFPKGSSGLGNPPASHWRALLWIVPAPELFTLETGFLWPLGSNGQQPIAVFHALFCSWPLGPTTLINSIREKKK